MSNEREIRITPATLRAATRGNKRTLSGRAAAYGTFSHNLGGFREIIKPGAFSNALKRGDETIFCMNHDPNLIMSRTRNNSLRLNESSGGLDFEADLPDTQAAKDLYALVSGGVITECSFAFKTDKDSWYTVREDNGSPAFESLFPGIKLPDDVNKKRGLPIRVLEDLTLYDASAVASPAYPQGTGVSANMDPGASGKMEGVSISQYALAEARKRGGTAT